MLALKSMRMPPLAAEHATICEKLPIEILDIIATQLYDSELGQVDALLPFSLVCRHFRQCALPFLFNTITHVVRDRLDQREDGLLRRLLKHAHLLQHVQTLHVLRPQKTIDFVPSLDQAGAQRLTREHTSSDLQVVKDGLPLMRRLRQLRYVYC